MYQPRDREIQIIEASADYLPSFKDTQSLLKFMTARGKIVSRSRTSLSQKQQRLLSREIKRARHLALLPMVSVLR